MARAIELLFAAGFSTAEQTSDISGRGVGMDAVRSAIRELGGAVMMTSEQGQGTTVQIRLPLTLAIMPALLTESGGRSFAIPLDRVERTLQLSEQTVRSVTGRRMLVLDDGVLPMLDAVASRSATPSRRTAATSCSRAAASSGWRSSSTTWSASASWSRGRCRRRSATGSRCPAAPCSPTARSH